MLKAQFVIKRKGEGTYVLEEQFSGTYIAYIGATMMMQLFWGTLFLAPAVAFIPTIPHSRALHCQPRLNTQPTQVRVMPLVDSPLVVADLVAASEVYGPIFGFGIFLCFSGFASAFAVGALIDEDNIEELGDQFFEKGLEGIAAEGVSAKIAAQAALERRESSTTADDAYLD